MSLVGSMVSVAFSGSSEHVVGVDFLLGRSSESFLGVSRYWELKQRNGDVLELVSVFVGMHVCVKGSVGRRKARSPMTFGNVSTESGVREEGQSPASSLL